MPRVQIFTCLIWSAVIPLGAAPLTRPYTVENYDVAIQVDLAKQHLSGTANIRLHGNSDISAVELDAGALQITSVLEGQYPQSFERNRGKLFIVLTNPLRSDEPRTITIAYQAAPSAGLHFYPDQVYPTATSDWMPCNAEPGARATLHLTISAPPGTKVAATSQLDSSVEPRWFGFAVGTFTESTSDAAGVKLRALGANPKTLELTTSALHDLAERTGKPYPRQTYTQVFIHGEVPRAMAGLALLPEKQSDDLRVLTSTLARQWYGVQIPAKSASDLWLSGALSAYLADPRNIESAQENYNQLRAAGKDRPLSDPEGENLKDKGVSFLYLLNQTVGDNKFKEALQLFTAGHWGQPSGGEDLQNAFDAVKPTTAKKASNTLDDLFDMWVYGITTPKPKR